MLLQEDLLAGLDLNALGEQYFQSADRSARNDVALTCHLDLAEQRKPGEIHIAPDEARRWIQIVCDDMPLLIESVTACASRLRVGLDQIIHPVLHVSRDAEGQLTGLDGELAESWIHLQLAQSMTRNDVIEFGRQLETVLADVHRVDADREEMRSKLVELAASLSGPFSDGELSDSSVFLQWLADGNYTLLGYARYSFDGAQAALGILRNESKPPIELDDDALIVLTRGRAPSTVHRSVYPYYVAVTGGHLFVGVLTVTAMFENVLDIPVINKRVRKAIAQAGFSFDSYSGQAMLELIQSLPRSELLSADVGELVDIASALLGVGTRREVRLFLREDSHTGFVSCLVYLPRDQFSTQVRLDMQAILLRELDGVGLDFSVRVSETDLATVYCTIRRAQPGADVSDGNRLRLQAMLTDVAKTWTDQLREVGGSELAQQFGEAFPESYKQDFDAARAVKDVLRLQRLGAGEIDVVLSDSDGWHFTLYVGNDVSLSQVLPALQSLGVEVLDERPYRISSTGWIYEFGLLIRPEVAQSALSLDVDDLAPRFEDAFRAVWFGEAEADSFNELVVMAGATWREVAVLRAYARYLRQAGFPYGQGIIARMLLTHAKTARLFIDLFMARFAPDRKDDAADIEQKLVAQVDQVVSLDADRILRAILGLIRATVRTNYFADRLVLSFKLEPRAISELPKPRPMFEIFVYAPRVEGVHLRFGPVARGGLRWSDRLEDFRTEVLGLVKAQAVKNAVIVPVGAKGGFVVKKPPTPTGDPTADRQAYMVEGIECYKLFVSGLLDLTDNIDRASGKVVGPPNVVRRDGDDTYLVVAADKGTASFSDIANAVAQEYGFWLGDAFASGGSAGYDHKAMGITARGAWESVKRHFSEMNFDTQTQDFTVAGVGDMSGDVFGNGMLLSRHIRLMAAFDHRHIFLDPNPDAASSFAERERMFALPRSSWADYDTKLISAGGGVWERTRKSIPVSPEAREVLGLGANVESLSPPELMRAILCAPVDLLWNGGIGTYIKASSESNAEVGDKANDAVRVNGDQVRAKVIGEGGNLGVTARGRIEFCAHGGRMNTDALDNSAGVDCSDHEVNIKILLDGVVTAGDLASEDRNRFLASMTDEVANLVLADNISQNTVMGISRFEAPMILNVHRRMISDLEKRRGLDRELEALPTDEQIVERGAVGTALTSPEIANLLAHVKLSVKHDLLASELPAAAVFANRLVEYFPAPIRDRFPKAIKTHPLRREIVATMLANDMVDHGGITYAYRLGEETGSATTDAARAFNAAVTIFGLRRIWQDLRATDAPTSTIDALELETKRCLDRTSRWLLANRPQPIAIGAEIHRYAKLVQQLTPLARNWMDDQRRASVERRASTYDGVPIDVASKAVELLDLFPLLDIIDIAEISNTDEEVVGELYYALDAHMGIDRLLSEVTRLERGDRWHALARLALRDDLYGSLGALVMDVLHSSEPDEPAAVRIADWESTNQSRLARARTALNEIFEEGASHDLATLSVAAKQIRSMVTGGGLQEKKR